MDCGPESDNVVRPRGRDSRIWREPEKGGVMQHPCMGIAKLACPVLLLGATVCFAYGTSQPDVQKLAGGACGCKNATERCTDYPGGDPDQMRYCDGGFIGICLDGVEDGNPDLHCIVGPHHCSALPPGMSPYCETLTDGNCVQ